MTDSTQFLPNTQALTDDLHFALKPSAVRSRSYRASILPTNKNSFNPTETCIMYVPCGRRNSYLDVGQSYLRLNIKNTDGANGLYLDGNGACVISRIDIFHGSNLLETIQAYNVLSTYIFDMQTSQSDRKGLSNIYGFDNGGDRKGQVLAAGVSLTCCIPLFSGVIGVLSDKSVPTGLMADDIRIEITFETQNNGVYAAIGNPQWQVNDIQLELTFIELSDEGESMVRQEADPNKPIYLHGSSWRHYASNLPTISGNFSTLVPARFASLKQLAICPRRSTDFVQASYTLSSRVNPNVSYFWYRIGSAIIPQKSVYLENISNTAGYGEGFCELLKSWHSLHTTKTSCALGTQYKVSDQATNATTTVTQADAAGANAYKNGFALAIELESMCQKSDVLLSGTNTLNSQIFWECQINTAPSVSYTLDFFAWYDHILILERGLLSVKY